MIRILKKKDCPFGKIFLKKKKEKFQGRKISDRNISYKPAFQFFKPNGVPATELNYIQLNLDEWEALRLKNVEDLNQNEAAEKMGISQSTFARILDSANKKVSMALVNGCAIEIINENN
jgi:predicted DNA-binding protein (UPF0251 family)